MIAWLSGKLRRRTADSVVIDVGGVGYHVFVPLSTLGGLPETGNDVNLHIHTHLREDSLSLFGFSTETEKDLFLLLMSVSGIGPKLALAVLSGLPAADLMSAIRSGDDAKLCSIPGIGKKTAARLCLELKEKVKTLAQDVEQPAQASHEQTDDAVSALVNLGYKRPSAEDAVKKIHAAYPNITVEGLIKEALAVLAQR